MANRKYDMVVKIGEYQKDGQTKGRYRNIGSILEGEDGKMFVLIDPHFNFAAIKRERDMVLVGLYEPKPKEDKPQAVSEEVTW